MAAAASRSRVRIAAASRASPLIALISQQPVARGRLDRFAGHGAGPAVAEPRLGVVLGPPHGARIRGRGGRLGRGLVLVVGALRRAVRSPRRRRPAVARGPRARSARPRAGGARRTDRSTPGRRPVGPAPTAPTARRRPRRRRCRSARQEAPWCLADPGRRPRSSPWRGARSGSGRLHRRSAGDVVLAVARARPSPTPSVIADVGRGSPERTGVRRSMCPGPTLTASPRRSAGPPRAGSAAWIPANASSARVEDRRLGTASGATVTRTSRGAGGRARRISTSAAPAATPRTSPSPRNTNSLAVTLPASPSGRSRVLERTRLRVAA